MGDQTKAVVFNQDPGQDSGKPSGKTEETNAAQQEVLTLNQVQRMVKEAEENVFRRAQGLIDKVDTRITKEVRNKLKGLDATLKVQRDAGIQITAEQEQALKNRIIQDGLTAEQQDPETLSPPNLQQEPAQEPEGDMDIDPITAEAWNMMDEANTPIEKDDPEFSMIVTDGTAFAFLKSVQEAIQAKKDRQASAAVGNYPGTTVQTGAVGNLQSNVPPIERLQKHYRGG